MSTISGMPPTGELSHYGVKGMKWGVRKSTEPVNSKYTTALRSRDAQLHGKRAVERINRRLNEGMSRQQALQREAARDEYQRLAVLGASVAASVLARHGGVVISRNHTSGAAGIGADATKPPFVKPNRHGVHKITTMK